MPQKFVLMVGALEGIDVVGTTGFGVVDDDDDGRGLLLKDVALSSVGSIIFPAQKRMRCHNGDTIERAGGQTIVV